MTQTRITRALSFVIVVLILPLQGATANTTARTAVFAVATALLVYLWLTSRRDTHTRLTLTLNRIAITGFALVDLWSVLNLIRVVTYDLRIEGPPSWKATVGNFAVRAQPPVFWSGIALALIFIVVLAIGLIAPPKNPESSTQ